MDGAVRKELSAMLLRLDQYLGGVPVTFSKETTNPHGQLKSTLFAFTFQGEKQAESVCLLPEIKTQQPSIRVNFEG